MSKAMIDKRKWLKDSIPFTGGLLQVQWAPLLVLFLLRSLLNIWAEDAVQVMTSTSDESSRWAIQLGLAGWDLIEGVLLLLILSWGIPKIRPPQSARIMLSPFTQPYLGSFLAEYLRQLAQVLMWALLLLIPGFFRYCKLIFVPMIALFSVDYREGRVDALRLSERLVSGRLFLIMGLMALTMGCQFLLGFAPEMNASLHTYFFRMFFDLIDFVINVWSFVLLFLLFEKFLNEAAPEELQ